MVETVFPLAQLGTIHVSTFANLPHSAIFAYDQAGTTVWALKVRPQARAGESADGAIILFPTPSGGVSPLFTRVLPGGIGDVVHFQGLHLRSSVDTSDLALGSAPLNGEIVSDGANFHICVTENSNRLFFNFQTGHASSPMRYVLIKRWSIVASMGKADEAALYEFLSPRDQAKAKLGA